MCRGFGAMLGDLVRDLRPLTVLVSGDRMNSVVHPAWLTCRFMRRMHRENKWHCLESLLAHSLKVPEGGHWLPPSGPELPSSWFARNGPAVVVQTIDVRPLLIQLLQAKRSCFRWYRREPSCFTHPASPQ
jgi:hypothetical protein